MADKINAIKEWLLNYPKLNNWLYLNALPLIQGSNSLNTVAGDRVVREDVTGRKRHEIVCSIDMVLPYDIGTSDTNQLALEEVDYFAKWIEDAGYPSIEGVTKVEVLNNLPELLINSAQSEAKYQFQIKITYESED